MQVECPQCHKKVEWTTTNPYRPFCSERCKQLDLGAWAEERYVIPGTASEHDEQPDQPAQ